MHTDTSDLDRSRVVTAVLEAYRNSPATLGHVRASDRELAGHLFDSQVPLQVVRAAFALATLRLRYPVDPVYLRYLEAKLRD